MVGINISVHQSGEKTEILRCNWCGLDHPIEAEYKATFLERNKEKAKAHGIEAADAWTCGKCMLVLMGAPPDMLKTECGDHEVPDKKYDSPEAS